MGSGVGDVEAGASSSSCGETGRLPLKERSWFVDVTPPRTLPSGHHEVAATEGVSGSLTP